MNNQQYLSIAAVFFAIIALVFSFRTPEKDSTADTINALSGFLKVAVPTQTQQQLPQPQIIRVNSNDITGTNGIPDVTLDADIKD